MKHLKLFLNAACLFTIWSSFISCQNTKENNSDKIPFYKTKSIKAYDKKKLVSSNLIKDIQFILLETKSESFFSQIDKIKIKNNYIYILDVTGLHHVFVFDLTGKFVKKIGKRGQGPGEYWRLTDFDVDNQNNVYLYDRQHMQMLKYNLNGTLISYKKTPFRADAFNILNRGNFIFSVIKDPSMENTNGYRVLVTDSNFNIKNKFFQYDEDFLDDKLNVGLFTESSKGILYNKPVNDSLYLFSYDGALKESYYLDFAKNAVPIELKNRYAKLSEVRGTSTYEYIYVMPFLIKNYIVGNIYTGNNKAMFLYDENTKHFHTKNFTQSNFSHTNINLPIAIIGDSTIVSYLDYEILEADIEKNSLNEKIINHIEQESAGFVLILYKVK